MDECSHRGQVAVGAGNWEGVDPCESATGVAACTQAFELVLGVVVLLLEAGLGILAVADPAVAGTRLAASLVEAPPQLPQLVLLLEEQEAV